jgi:ectoine hydroxylase-related dioxygenase (phytanoyl-CoA dioxygenase family)
MLDVSRIDARLVQQFDRDGAAFLPRAFAPRWIEVLRAGFRRLEADPGPRLHEFIRTPEGKVFRSNSDNWRRIAEYETFVRQSPCAEIAAGFMQSKKAFLFFDQSFYRSHGQQFRTPWHQDEPYWSIEGFQTIGIWMPLVPVEKKSSLAFILGSHRWEQRYRQIDFDDLSPEALKDKPANLDGDGWLPLPDFDADPDRWRVTSWDMEPGDCVMFNGRTYHGGSGLLSSDRDLSVFNTKWAGDDVRVIFRQCKMQPDHREKMISGGMKPGDPLDPRTYPLLWPRAG